MNDFFFLFSEMDANKIMDAGNHVLGKALWLSGSTKMNKNAKAETQARPDAQACNQSPSGGWSKWILGSVYLSYESGELQVSRCNSVRLQRKRKCLEMCAGWENLRPVSSPSTKKKIIKLN